MPKGKVEVEFSAEQQFKAFKRDFAKCEAHFKATAGVDASLKNLVSGGGYKYRVDFESKVKCDGILKFINLAVKKTVPDGDGLAAEEAPGPQPGELATGDYVQDTLATIEVHTAGFTTRLLACGL